MATRSSRRRRGKAAAQVGEPAIGRPLRAAKRGVGTTSGAHVAAGPKHCTADGAGADAQLRRHLSEASTAVVQAASFFTGRGGERLVAHLDSGTSHDPGDSGSVDSEVLRDLLDGHAGCVGVEELLTLRVAQTSLRLECLGLRLGRADRFERIVRVERRGSVSFADYG